MLYICIYIFFFCESTSQTRYGEDFLGKKTVVLVAMHCPSSEKHQRRSSSRMRVAAVPILPRKDGSNKGGVRAQITRAFFHEPRKSDISRKLLVHRRCGRVGRQRFLVSNTLKKKCSRLLFTLGQQPVSEPEGAVGTNAVRARIPFVNTEGALICIE